MSTVTQIKQIHTLKNILGLDDDLYRDMLASFDVCSSKDLTVTEAAIFISILNDKVKVTGRNCSKKYEEFTGRDNNMATPKQLRLLEVLWSDICDETTQEGIKKSLRNFVKKQFHVDDIRFMTKDTGASRARYDLAIVSKLTEKECVEVLKSLGTPPSNRNIHRTFALKFNAEYTVA